MLDDILLVENAVVYSELVEDITGHLRYHASDDEWLKDSEEISESIAGDQLSLQPSEEVVELVAF
jgi:hypothetical protein